MDKLKTIGLTALAGSLAAVNANAGEMTVSGAFAATYVTGEGDTGNIATDHGVGLGSDKDVTFSGSGELDNGFTFSGYTLMKEGSNFNISSSALSLTMGSMGTITTGQGFGGASTKYDEQTPTAWEEVDDQGAQSSSANIMGSFGDDSSLVYNSPSFELGDFSASFDVEYSPESGITSQADGGHANSTTWDGHQALGVTVKGLGLTVGVYGAERERTAVPNNTTATDQFDGVWYANYSFGPVSLGYSKSYVDAGVTAASDGGTTKAAKTVGTATGIFEAETYSVAFNVNDNLSLSYATTDDVYDAQSHTKATATEVNDVTTEFKSIQAAYSMGAMSLKFQRTETTTVGYDANGGSRTDTELNLGLAF